jgi:hypothetical protein
MSELPLRSVDIILFVKELLRFDRGTFLRDTSTIIFKPVMGEKESPIAMFCLGLEQSPT